MYRFIYSYFTRTFAAFFLFFQTILCAAVEEQKPLILLSDSFKAALFDSLKQKYSVRLFASNQGDKILKDVMALPLAKRPQYIIGLDHHILARAGYDMRGLLKEEQIAKIQKTPSLRTSDKSMPQQEGTKRDFVAFKGFCYEAYGFISRQRSSKIYASYEDYLKQLPDQSLIFPDPRFSNTGLCLLTVLPFEDYSLLRQKTKRLTDRMMSSFHLFKKGVGEVLFAYHSTPRALRISQEHLVKIKTKAPAVVYTLFRARHEINIDLEGLMESEDTQRRLYKIAYMSTFPGDFNAQNYDLSLRSFAEIQQALSAFCKTWAHE